MDTDDRDVVLAVACEAMNLLREVWKAGSAEGRLAELLDLAGRLDALLSPDSRPVRVVYVDEGWWHPNVKDGRVHLHPERPGGAWSIASHRQCEPVYTRRLAREDPST